MCGVFGHFGKPTKKTPKIIRQLGILNMERGKDSTGMAFIDMNEAVIYKNIITADVFFQKTKDINQLLYDFRRKPFAIHMGHTRKATHGDITQENSHPFVEEDIIFSHNGIINNFYSLQKIHDTDYKVDSQIIGKMLTKEGIKGLDRLSGYFTIVYVSQKEPDVLRVAIHNNIFSYAYRDDQLYYSSDIIHLRKALSNKPNFTFVEIDRNSDVLLSVYLVNDHITIAKENISPISFVDHTHAVWSKSDKDEYGYDDAEYYDEYKGYCFYGDKCMNKRDHKQIQLPEETEWSRTHKLLFTRECIIGKWCTYLKDHKRMDAFEREYHNGKLKQQIDKKLYREKYKKKKGELKDAIDQLSAFPKHEVRRIIRP